METKNNVVTLVEKPTMGKRLAQAAVVAAAVVVSNMAMAASSIDAAGLTAEIDGAKSTVIGLFGAGLIVLGIFAGWRYLKRGANSA